MRAMAVPTCGDLAFERWRRVFLQWLHKARHLLLWFPLGNLLHEPGYLPCLHTPPCAVQDGRCGDHPLVRSRLHTPCRLGSGRRLQSIEALSFPCFPTTIRFGTCLVLSLHTQYAWLATAVDASSGARAKSFTRGSAFTLG